MNKRAAQSDNAASSKWPIARFILLFAILMGVFYAVASTPWFRNQLFPAYLELNASVAAAILHGLGEEAHASGADVISPRFALAILRGCDGIEPAALFVAAVLAFPAAWRSKGTAVIVGTALLLTLNLVRIISLYYTGIYFPNAFESVHVDLWQTLFILIVMAMWMMWAWRASGRLRANTSENR